MSSASSSSAKPARPGKPSPGTPPAPPAPAPALTVLQVLPALKSGGVERGTLEIAEAIIAAGGKAVVASAGGPLVGKLEKLGAKHVTLPLDTKSPFGIWRNAGRLAQLIRREQVAIVHARSRGPAWSAMLAARRTNRPFITTYHATYNAESDLKRWYNSVMARGQRVIAISRFIADHIAERYPEATGRITIIPRGADLREFDPVLVAPERVAQLRQRWGLPADRPVVMLAARLSRWKGHAVLIEAMKRLPPGPIAVLVGDGSARMRNDLEAQIESEELEDRVRLVGHCHDMAAAYLLADVVVHASTDAEAFGRVVVEAQAMGRPVIAADRGGPRETVEDGVTGWLIKPGSRSDLAATLARVLGLSQAERTAIGLAARQAVEARYSLSRMQAATLAVYREVL